MACQAYQREVTKKSRAKNQARIEAAEKASSSTDLIGSPSRCSDEAREVCVSKNNAQAPEFQRMKNGKWYKTCVRYQITKRENDKNLRKRHNEEAQKQGKHYCSGCSRYLDDCAFGKNEDGKNKAHCVKCCETQSRNDKLNTNRKIQ